MMTWLAWTAIALATLVAAVNLWMTWQRLADAYRVPAEPEAPEEHSSKHQLEVEHNAPPPAALGELDERGYLFSKKLRMGCEAAICRTPFGARIVVGKSGLEEPQYAWDYTSVAQAQKALAGAKFRTDPEEGIIVDESYPGVEPRNYSRRWKYASDGQVQRFEGWRASSRCQRP